MLQSDHANPSPEPVAALAAEVLRLRRQVRLGLWLLGGFAVASAGWVALPVARAVAIDSILLATKKADLVTDANRLVIPTDADQVTVRFDSSDVSVTSGNVTATSPETTGTSATLTANSVTTGTALSISATGLTTGTAVSVTSGATTGSAVTETSTASTGTAHTITANSVTTGTALSISATGLTAGTALSVSAPTAAGTASYAAIFKGGKLRLPTFAVASEPAPGGAAAGDLYYDSTNDRLRIFQPPVGGGVALWRNEGADFLTGYKSGTTTPTIPSVWTILPTTAAISTSVPGVYVVTYHMGTKPGTGSFIGIRIRDTTGPGVTRAVDELYDARADTGGAMIYNKTTTVLESLEVQWAASAATIVPAGDVLLGETLNGFSMDFYRYAR